MVRPSYGHDFVCQSADEQTGRVRVRMGNGGNGVARDKWPDPFEHGMPAGGTSHFDPCRRAAVSPRGIAILKTVVRNLRMILGDRVSVESRPMGDDLEPAAKDNRAIGAGEPAFFGGRQIDAMAPYVGRVEKDPRQRRQCRVAAALVDGRNEQNPQGLCSGLGGQRKLGSAARAKRRSNARDTNGSVGRMHAQNASKLGGICHRLLLSQGGPAVSIFAQRWRAISEEGGALCDDCARIPGSPAAGSALAAC